MKHFSFFASMLCIGFLMPSKTTHAQSFDWGQSVLPSVYNDLLRDVAVIDNSLNYKVAVGSFQPTSATGTYDGLVYTTDINDQLKWYITVEGSGNDEVNGVDARAKTVSGVSQGDIYFTGYFTGSVNMVLHYGFPLHHFTTTIHSHSAPSGNSNDCTYFVTKVDQDGAHVWTQIAGSTTQTNTEIGNDVDVNLVGSAVEVYTTGFFRGSTSFYSGTTASFSETSSASWNSIFTAKYVDNGSTATCSWVSPINDNSDNQHDYGYGVVGDGSGNVYMTGSIGGNTTVGTNTMTVTGNDDAIAVKYNSSGSAQWSLNFGGNGTAATPSDQGRGIGYLSGYLYLSGYYCGSGDFTTSTPLAGFVAKLDASTGAFSQKNTITSSGTDACYRLCISPNGNHFYVAGSMTGDATVKNSGTTIWATITSVSLGTNADGFLVAFNSSLNNVEDAQYLSSDDGSDGLTGVVSLTNAGVYAVGTFTGSMLYDAFNVFLTNTGASNTRDAYLMHYDTGFSPRLAGQTSTETSSIANVYPNPTSGELILNTTESDGATVTVLDLMGRIVLAPQTIITDQTSIDLSMLPSGTYLIKVSSDKMEKMLRVIKN